MHCCERNFKLISFKWDENGNVIEVYRCKDCGKIIEAFVEAEDVDLKDLIIDNDFYNRYNL